MKFVSTNDVSTLYEIVVIGGGPTGLAASLSFSQDKITSVLLVESGKEFVQRDRYDPNDMSVGMGGAGLFSDGKFSFYPSSSVLWKKLAENYETLYKSYKEVKVVLVAQGLNVPEFPCLSDTEDQNVFSEWFLKEYPSFYLNLQQRQNLISQIQNSSNITCCIGSQLIDCTKAKSGEFLLLIEDTTTGHQIKINTKNVLYCGGRFGSIFLSKNQLFEPHMQFHRLELGFRIEQHTTESFFVQETTLTDPKFKFVEPSGNVEWRTFCACKDGEAVLSTTQGLWTVSGRADCEPTGKSNIGLNTRIKDPGLAAEVLKHVVSQVVDKKCYFDISLLEFLTGKVDPTFDSIVSKPMRKHMQKGLRLLVERFPKLLTSPTARLKGPTIEGVGWYPELNSQLKIDGMNFWVAGDAAGCFRGITSALISGFYAAEMIKTKIKEGS